MSVTDRADVDTPAPTMSMGVTANGIFPYATYDGVSRNTAQVAVGDHPSSENGDEHSAPRTFRNGIQEEIRGRAEFGRLTPNSSD